MFQKIAKHRANDASNDVHRPPLQGGPRGSRETRGTSRQVKGEVQLYILVEDGWGIVQRK